MNVNKDKEVIRRQPNNIRYLNGRFNEILDQKIQTSLSWGEKSDADTLLQHSKKNLGSGNCV